jgi:hypothetical protein
LRLVIGPIRPARITNRAPTKKNKAVTKTKQNYMGRLVSPIRSEGFTNRTPIQTLKLTPTNNPN